MLLAPSIAMAIDNILAILILRRPYLVTLTKVPVSAGCKTNAVFDSYGYSKSWNGSISGLGEGV